MPLETNEPRTIEELAAQAVLAHSMGPEAVRGFVRGLGLFDEVPRWDMLVKAVACVVQDFADYVQEYRGWYDSQGYGEEEGE
jgi:hypothetical protein